MYHIIEGIIIIAAVGGAAFFILRKLMKAARSKRPDCCPGGNGQNEKKGENPLPGGPTIIFFIFFQIKRSGGFTKVFLSAMLAIHKSVTCS
jgi:hypothetical protein